MRLAFTLIGLALLLFKTKTTLAKPADSIEMNMIYNNPDYTYFGMGSNIFQSYNAHNFTLVGVGLDARFTNQRLFFKSDFRMHFNALRENQLTEEPDQVSLYKKEFPRDFKADVFLKFKGDYKKDYKVVYAGRTESSTVNPYTLNFNRRNQTGLGIGYAYHFTNYFFIEEELEAIRLVDSKKVNLSGTTASQFSQHIVRLFFSWFSSYDYNTSFSNEQLEYTEYKSGAFNHFYSGILIGLNQRYENVVNKVYAFNDSGAFDFDEYIFAQYTFQDNLSMSPFGIAIGYEWFKMKQDVFLNTAWNIEGGLLPGSLDHIQKNFYLDLSVSFRIGSKNANR